MKTQNSVSDKIRTRKNRPDLNFLTLCLKNKCACCKLSFRSVLPRDWVRGDRFTSRGISREARRHHVCKRTPAQCDQVSRESGAGCRKHLNPDLFSWFRTEAGRGTSEETWRMVKTFPVGSSTTADRASSTERRQTTLCRAFSLRSESK